jgi:hypothetical protein
MCVSYCDTPWILPLFTLNWISSNRQPSVKLAPKGKLKERISEEGVGDSYGLRKQAHKTSACVDRQLLQAHIAVQWLPTRLRLTSWVENSGLAILREIEDSSLLWYCAVSNGGYERFERVLFLHVQNLSRQRRVNWLIIGKPRETFLFLFSNSGHTASFHVLSNSLLIHRTTTGWNIVRGVSGK